MAADERGRRILAAELRITAGDLARLETPGLPAAHRAGIDMRLDGALGLLPWLLLRAGDEAGAAELAARPDALAPVLQRLAARHPLDFAENDLPVSSAKREARLIHQSYCAGCHDGAEDGDPDVALPARDLYRMAGEEASEIFLARLLNGIKGDETIGFRLPLSDTQVLALWRVYSGG